MSDQPHGLTPVDAEVEQLREPPPRTRLLHHGSHVVGHRPRFAGGDQRRELERQPDIDRRDVLLHCGALDQLQIALHALQRDAEGEHHHANHDHQLDQREAARAAHFLNATRAKSQIGTKTASARMVTSTPRKMIRIGSI